MIKKVLFTLLQFVLFLILFAAGGVLPIFGLPSVISRWAGGTRGFQWDGIFLMLALLVVILLIQALRKRIRSASPWTALAFALAAIAGLVMKFGFMSFDR